MFCGTGGGSKIQSLFQVTTSSVLFLAFNVFFLVIFLRMKAARTRAGRSIAGAILAAGAAGLALLSLANPTMFLIYIPTGAFYLIFFSRRLKPAGKFFWSAVPFHFLILVFAPHLYAAGAAPWVADRALIGLHFFNFFYSFPFMVVSRRGWFHSAVLGDVVGEFVSRQALFGFRYAPGMTLLACLGFSYIVMRISRRYAPWPGERWLEDVRFSLWVPAAGAAAGVVFYLRPGIAPLAWMAALVWPVALALAALQGIVLCGGVVARRYGGGLFIPLAVFLTLLSRHAFIFFAAVGALDMVLGLGIAVRAAVRGTEDGAGGGVTGRGPQGKRPRPALTALVYVLAVIPAFVLGSSGGSPGTPDPYLPDPGRAAKFRKTSEEAGRVTIEGPGASFRIDMYEYPNREGEPPLAGVDIHAAREKCAAAGGRLCFPPEWTAACVAGGGGYQYYLMKERKGAQELIEEKCRTPRGVLPAGSRAGCANGYGIYDMMGNAWEMVEVPGKPGMVGFMGQGHGSNYEVLNQCNWITTVYENQAREFMRGNIGFRCCAPVRAGGNK